GAIPRDRGITQSHDQQQGITPALFVPIDFGSLVHRKWHSGASLFVNGGGLAAQNVLLNLAGSSFGEFRYKSKAVRDLEVRHTLPPKAPGVVFRGAGPGLDHHKGPGPLPPLPGGPPHYSALLSRGMPQQDAFPLDQKNIPTAADNYVFQPVAHLDV